MIYRLNKYLLHYNIFISMCAVSLVLYFSVATQTSVPPSIYIMTFFGTLAIYNLFRLYPNLKEYLKHPTLTSSKLIIYSLVLSGVCYLVLPKELKLLYVLPIILSLCYKFPIINHKDLRSIPFIKVFIIAAVWILIGAIPVIQQAESIHTLIPRMAAQFLFFVAITIPFDVFDVEKDKIKTFATKLGAKKAIAVAKLCLVLHLFLAVANSLNYQEMIAHVIVSAITFMILSIHHRLSSRKLQYYCVDGLILLQTFLIIILH